VCLVVAFHAAKVLLPSTEGKVLSGGFLGVDLFFVLSGFLITALLLVEHDDRGRISLSHFYLRRALRLLPALLMFIAAHVAYAAATGLDLGAEFDRMLGVLFYFENWNFIWDFEAALLNPEISSSIGHLWSLSIEEQFYIVWPMLVVLLLRVRKSAVFLAACLVSLIVAVIGWRWHIWDQAKWLFIYVRTDARADSLVVGALTAVLWTDGRLGSRHLRELGMASAAALLVAVLWLEDDDEFLYLGGYTLVAVLAAVVIVAAVEDPWMVRLLSGSGLRLIGRVSYGIYIWHLFVFAVTMRYFGDWPAIARVALAIGVLNAIVLVSWYVVERPALRLKDARVSGPSFVQR
jgi:peptidoglycan/LPS O-acetylase OafA/YrhL